MDKDVDGLVGANRNPFSDDVNKLAEGEVYGNEVFFLVNIGHVARWGLFDDDGDSFGIFITNSGRFDFSLLERMVGFERRRHYLVRFVFCTFLLAQSIGL